MKSIADIKNDTLTITYQGEKVTLDITKELSINQSLIDTEAKEAPSNYGFLCLLRDNHQRKVTKLTSEKEKLYAKAWSFYRESGSTSNESAHQKAIQNDAYLEALEKLQKAEHILDKLNSIVKAYEAKLRLIQTIQANIRKQI